MAEHGNNLYLNPAELALPHAERLVKKGLLDDFDKTPSDEEQKTLAVVEQEAADLGLLDKPYFVNAGRSFLLPTAEAITEEIKAVFFDDIYFQGELVTYSTVRLGRFGSHVIRAFCLTFDNVRALPGIDELTTDETLFHVPAFAVRDIDMLNIA